MKLTHWLCARAQIPLPPSDERKKVVEDVDRDRRYSIDAAIVRTMKSRKVLQHQQVGLPLDPCQLTRRTWRTKAPLLYVLMTVALGRPGAQWSACSPACLSGFHGAQLANASSGCLELLPS